MRLIRSKLSFPAFLFGAFLLITVAVFAFFIVSFPTGFVVRIAIIFFILLTLGLSWALRRQDNTLSDPIMFSLMVFVVSLSILWPRYIFFHFGGLPSINPYTALIMVGLYSIFVSFVYSPSFSARIAAVFRSSGWSGKLVLAWFVWRLLACFLGSEPLYSLVGFVRELIYVGSFFLFGCVLAANNGSAKWLVRAVVICGVIVGSAGVIEGVTQHNFFTKFATAGEEGDMSGALANVLLDKIRGGQYRAQSTFDHPIVFAQFLAALVPLAIYGLLRETSKFWRLVACIALPIALLAIAKSGSRSGIVSVVIAFGLMGCVMWLRAIAHGKISKVIAIVALPALLGAIGIGYLVLQELAIGRSQQEMGSSGYRLQMLNLGVSALFDSPLWGFGQGLAISKAGIVNPAGLATIDNYFLSIALDSGYVGFALMVLFLLVFSFKSLAFAIAESSADGLLVGACLAAVLAIVATFAGLSILNNMTLLWLLMTATFPFLGRATGSSARYKGI